MDLNDKVEPQPRPDLDFSKREARKTFIQTMESSLYDGFNVDGERVLVCVEQGRGMTIKTLNSKNWWSCVDYDENGYPTGTYPEPNNEDQKQMFPAEEICSHEMKMT